MTPWRDGQSGSFVLDRRVRGIGRIKRASGTTSPAVFKKMNRAVTQLADQGRVDILRALRDGTITVREFYDAFQRGETATLPTAKAGRPLVASWTAWIAKKDCGAAHKRSLAQSLRHMHANAETRIADLPDLLEAARDRLRAHPQSFRLCRSACQAFVKATLKRSHPLYAEMGAVEPLKIRAQRTKHPAAPYEMWAVLERLPILAKPIARTICLTGMRCNEFWGTWSTELDRVHIHGTKTKGAERVVPNLIGIARWPGMTYRAFRLALAEASDGQMTPYDLRRTYATWLEAAGIPRTRRRLYLGHGNQDVTDIYEWHEVTKFLEEDAAKIRAFLGISHENSHGAILKLHSGETA